MNKNNKLLYCIAFVLLFVLTNYGYKFIVDLFQLKNYISVDILELLITIIDILLVSILLKKDLKDDLKNLFPKFKENFKKIWWIYILMVVVEIISIIAVSGFLENISTNQQIVDNSALWLKLLVGIILAPFAEELLYRCLLRKIIKNNLLFIISSGIIFAFIHVIGETNIVNMILFSIPYFVGGAFLAVMYCRTNNIFMIYIAHVLHNFI